MAYDPDVFNVDPYYDDYDDTKKFLRVFYKPGYAVQARELTQSQTILQTQIKRFGDHVFKDGSIVSESQVVVNDTQFVRVASLTGYAGVSISDFDGLTAVVSGKNTIRVINTLAGLSGSNKDTSSLLFFSEYLYGATGFDLGDTISAVYQGTTISATVTGGTSTYNVYSGAPNSLPAFGDAKLVGVDAGVRYIKGYFVNHDKQKVTPYAVTDSSTANSYRKFNELDAIVKFDVTNTIVTATDDTSLNDPAFGSYNYAAPGADRYRLDLELAHAPLSSTADYQLLKIENDEVTYKTNYPEYNVLADTLARRTYDESGNYTVDDFQISVSDMTADAYESQLKINIGKGKAYIFGYEFINQATKSLTADKARNIKTLDSQQQVPFVVGNTVNVVINPSLTANIFNLINFNGSTLFYLSSGPSGAFSRVGTARLGKFDAVEYSGTKLHLYDILMDSGYTASAAQRLFLPGYTASDQHVFNFYNDTFNISDASYSSLVFPLSNDISSYAVREIISHGINIQRSAQFNLSTSSPTLVSVTDFDAGTEFSSGSWMDFTSFNDVKAFSLTGNPVSLYLNGAFGAQSFSITAGSGGTAVVFVNMDISESSTNNPFFRTKTSTTETLSVSMVANSYEKYAYLNGKVDVYEIVSITGNTGGSSFSMNDYFTLDTGQRDSIYDWSRIVLKKNYFSAGVTGVSVTFKRYDHPASSAPYLLNSYGDPSTMVSATGAAYKQVPVYVEESGSRKVISLGGCLDARPDRITPSSFGITSYPQDYGATGGCNLIGNSFDIAWSYYQPRTDKIVLTRDKEFKIIQGISGNDQAPEPQDVPDAMTLASITYLPYTKSSTDTTKFIVKNRRYTMRDIGSLEKRIDRLEYYTTLSLAEKEAKSLEIQDQNGLNKFKNGIFVDNFESRTNSDYLNRDHLCAIDPVRLEARPRFTTKYVDFGLSGSIPSGLTFNSNGLLTCNYTTDVFIQQRFASKAINVNPFDVTNFNGRLTMTPQSDDWIDTQTLPDVVVNVNGQNDGVGDLAEVYFGTVWNNWETTWAGTPVSTGVWREIGRTPPHSVLRPGTTRGLVQRVDYGLEAAQETVQTRTGTRTRLVPETTTQSIGSRIVDVSIVPFMRAVNINIKADGMRPNVRVYPFFDNQDVSQYVAVNGTSGGAIFTDVNGRVGYSQGITFGVPSGTFRTGERLLRLIDDSSNVLSNCTTTAEDSFRAQGLIQTEENTVLSTRNLVIRRESVTQDRIFNNTIVTDTRSEYVDPVAQTFLVDPVANPNGLYISKVEVFFKTKSSNLPITLQLRPAVNGYPSSGIIIPFSEVIKLPSDVNVSDDGSSSTTFQFDSPIYLQPGEYSMVLLSNSNEYEVFVSEVGQNDTITEEIIATQPYGGSFFKSQNSSTWTAEQMLDLKFTIHKCVFDTSGGTVYFNFTETNFDSGISGITNGANLFRLNSTYIAPPSTSISTAVDFEGDGLGSVNILPNENLIFATKKNIKDAGTDTITASISLDTDDNSVTPALDLQRVSGLYIQNLILNFNDQATQETYESLASVAGITADQVSPMRYISRQINLQDGFESTDVDVYLTARLPRGSDIGVYLKSQAKTDNTRFDDIPYEKLIIHPSYANSYGVTSQYLSVGEDDYVDLRFTRGGTATARTSGITGQEEFRKFQLKVVMYGDYTNTVVPAFKDFKVIAT